MRPRLALENGNEPRRVAVVLRLQVQRCGELPFKTFHHAHQPPPCRGKRTTTEAGPNTSSFKQGLSQEVARRDLKQRGAAETAAAGCTAGDQTRMRAQACDAFGVVRADIRR